MDTDSHTRRRHLEVYRSMSPARRVELGVAMSEELRFITKAAIRSRNPAFTEEEVMRSHIELLYGVRIVMPTSTMR